MNLREPKKKRRCRLQSKEPLPIHLNEQKWTVYTAFLTNFGSCIADPEEMKAVYNRGYFGKGSLSRSYPKFDQSCYGLPSVIRDRQWKQRQKWFDELNKLNEYFLKDSENLEETQESETDNRMDTNKPELGESNKKHNNKKIQEENYESTSKEIKDKVAKESIDEIVLDLSEEEDIIMLPEDDTSEIECSQKKIAETDNDGNLLVLPDSDSDTEEYLKNIKPRIEKKNFLLKETLHLTSEETFFLLFGLGCLKVINFDGSTLDINSTWMHFCKNDNNFIEKYVTYHYFRSKGWVVKPGLQYGGDFLLYKKGPPFYHASYIVIIEVLDADTLTRIPNKSNRNLSWSDLLGINRLSETVAKEILFTQILWPSSVNRNSIQTTPHIISEFTVKELLWRRWNPNRTREIMCIENDNDCSN